MEKAVENALDKLEKGYSTIAFDKISSEVGVNPSEIESIIHRMVKKSRIEVRTLKGEKVFLGKSSKDEQINQIPKSYQKVQS